MKRLVLVTKKPAMNLLKLVLNMIASKKHLRFVCCAAGFLLFAGSLPVYADPVNITTSFDCVGYNCNQSQTHNDLPEYKGLLTLTATNRGTQSWGDFHFQIYSLQQTGWSSLTNVSFDTTAPNQPTYSIGSGTLPLTWSVTNGTPTSGATLDLFFYANPVAPNQTATFTVYTDNTIDQGFFGVMFYPTPVPLPGAAWLLGPGIMGLIAARRRFMI